MELLIKKIKYPFRDIPARLLWLTSAITLTIIPHIPRIPIWITILFFSLTLMRLMISKNQRPGDLKINAVIPLLKLITIVGMFTGIYLSYGTLVGRDAGVSLLIVLVGMKIMEIKHERDYYIASFIALLLIMTNFFYNESIMTAVYMTVCVIVIVSALICFNDQQDYLNPARRLHVAGAILLQAVPLMLILFLLFPRITGPLWGLPKDAYSGVSGLDDEMSPGSISQLTLSNKVAFRVEFNDAIPSKSSLYWRGPVLMFTDGVKWGPDRPRRRQQGIQTEGEPVHYTVTLEPTNKNWLFGLELPTEPPKDGIFSRDMQIFSKTPIRERKRYSMASYTRFQLPGADQNELKKALQLPPGYHGQAIDLAQSWRARGMDDTEIINNILKMFNEEDFYYTTTPPTLLDDSVDQFLFETRQGFCEHYASAFVILMRAAGIPARVVTGYQGGSINPVGNYLIVRQRDAHAWAEIWSAARGWVRIDPTSAVSPTRILEGIETALPDSIIDIPLGLKDSIFARDMWRQIRNSWDAINNRWNQWVLGYNTERQFQFLNRFGLGGLDHTKLFVSLILTVAFILVIVAIWLFRQAPVEKDEVKNLYDKFCKRLARLGVVRRSSEGPKDFATRAARNLGHLQEEITCISNLYIKTRYGGHKELIETLKHNINAFKPQRTGT